MTTSVHAFRALGHSPYVARAVSDGSALAGPFPGMSGRAALIARSLSVALLLGWAALTDTRLLVMLAFVAPFWIAVEFEVAEARSKRVSMPRILRLSRF